MSTSRSSTSRYRALAFRHPDFDAGGMPGPALSATGGLGMTKGDLSVRQAILMLVSTLPGERLLRPDYGCALASLAFAPNDETTAGLAIHYVREALERWEPRIEILNLDAGADPERASHLNVELGYRVRATQSRRQLTIPVNLAGGKT